jgi:hypothetical protein
MNEIKEMSVNEMKQRIGRCHIAAIPLSITANRFREELVESGSAQLLVKYDEMHKTFVGFRSALSGELQLSEESASSNFASGLAALVFVVAPWCYGVYKFIA